jgi:hypothetical protein
METFLFSLVFPGVFIACAIWKFGGFDFTSRKKENSLFQNELNEDSSNLNSLSYELRNLGKISFGIALFLLIGIFQGIFMGRSRFLNLFNQNPILFIILSLFFLISFPLLFYFLAKSAEKINSSSLNRMKTFNFFSSLNKEKKRRDAIKKLKEAKDLRDSGIISNDEFIKISKKYKPHILDDEN